MKTEVSGAEWNARVDLAAFFRIVANFGWDVRKVDGHDIDAIRLAGNDSSSRPMAILCYTDPSRGLPILQERYPVLHYLRFKSSDEQAQYQAAYEEMSR